MQRPTHRLRLSEIGPHVKCVLCLGYLIDATTIVECLHSFCRSCLLNYLSNNNIFCPICDVQIHKTNPLLSIKPDKTLQDIVYKLVPGLFRSEMRQRRLFYAKHPQKSRLVSPEERGVGAERVIYSPDDTFSLSMEYYDVEREREERENSSSHSSESCNTDSTSAADSTAATASPLKRYLQCPALVTIGILKKFIRMKFDLTCSHRVEVFHRRVCLANEYTLMDVAYIYTWKGSDPMRFFYRISEVSEPCVPPPASHAPAELKTETPATEPSTSKDPDTKPSTSTATQPAPLKPPPISSSDPEPEAESKPPAADSRAVAADSRAVAADSKPSKTSRPPPKSRPSHDSGNDSRSTNCSVEAVKDRRPNRAASDSSDSGPVVDKKALFNSLKLKRCSEPVAVTTEKQVLKRDETCVKVAAPSSKGAACSTKEVSPSVNTIPAAAGVKGGPPITMNPSPSLKVTASNLSETCGKGAVPKTIDTPPSAKGVVPSAPGMIPTASRAGNDIPSPATMPGQSLAGSWPGSSVAPTSLETPNSSATPGSAATGAGPSAKKPHQQILTNNEEIIKTPARRPAVAMAMPGEALKRKLAALEMSQRRPPAPAKKPRLALKPGPASQKLGLGIQKPGQAIQKPGPAVQKPGPAIQKPGPAVQKPGPAIQKPGPAVQTKTADGPVAVEKPSPSFKPSSPAGHKHMPASVPKPSQSGGTKATPGQSGGTKATPGQSGGLKATPGQSGGLKATPGQSGGLKATPGQSGGLKATPGQSGGLKASPSQSGGLKATPGQSGGLKASPSQSGGLKATPGQSGGLKATPGQSGGLKATPGQSGGLKATPGQSGGLKATPGQSGGLKATPGQSGGLKATPSQSGGLKATPSQSGGLKATPGQSGGLKATPGQSGGLKASPGQSGGLKASPGPNLKQSIVAEAPSSPAEKPSETAPRPVANELRDGEKQRASTKQRPEVEKPQATTNQLRPDDEKQRLLTNQLRSDVEKIAGWTNREPGDSEKPNKCEVERPAIVSVSSNLPLEAKAKPAVEGSVDRLSGGGAEPELSEAGPSRLGKNPANKNNASPLPQLIEIPKPRQDRTGALDLTARPAKCPRPAKPFAFPHPLKIPNLSRLPTPPPAKSRRDELTFPPAELSRVVSPLRDHRRGGVAASAGPSGGRGVDEAAALRQRLEMQARLWGAGAAVPPEWFQMQDPSYIKHFETLMKSLAGSAPPTSNAAAAAAAAKKLNR